MDVVDQSNLWNLWILSIVLLGIRDFAFLRFSYKVVCEARYLDREYKTELRLVISLL